MRSPRGLGAVPAGGGRRRIAAALAGTIATRLAASRAAREAAVSSRRQTLVGVNNYPDLSRKAPASAHLPADAAGAWRLAVPLEAARNRTLQHSEATGRCPRVLLLTRGDVQMRAARANFCRNFFGCGGFGINESDDSAGSGGKPDRVVQLGSRTLQLAEEVCAAVQVPVLVAGNPGDRRMRSRRRASRASCGLRAATWCRRSPSGRMPSTCSS